MAKFPFLTYGGAAAPLAARAALWVCSQGISVHPPEWLQGLPWTWVVTISASLWFGQVLADIRNDASWLRAYYDQNVASFVLLDINNRTVGGRVCLCARMKATRNLSNVTIALNIMTFQADKTLVYRRGSSVFKGEEITIPLLEIKADGFIAGSWNPLSEDSCWALARTRHIVQIVFRSRFRPSQVRALFLYIGSTHRGESLGDVPIFVTAEPDLLDYEAGLLSDDTMLFS